MIGQLKLLARLYWRPFSSMSALLDEGNWVFGAVLVVLVSGVLQYTLVNRQQDAVRAMVPAAAKHTPGNPAGTAPSEEDLTPHFDAASMLAWQLIAANRFSVFTTLLGLMVLFVPAAILVACAVEPLGGVGVVLYRDYGGMATCTLMAWVAAHLPLAAVGMALPPMPFSPAVMFGPWLAAKVLFASFVACAARTVFGADLWKGYVIAAAGLIALAGAFFLFQVFGPMLGFFSSPFVLYYLYYMFGRNAQSSWGNLSAGFRSRANFRRQLEAAAVNPHDAEPHYQLGLVYRQRRQTTQAADEFRRAIAIDPTETDAHYQLGRIAREQGRLGEALAYCETAARQNDKHAFSEVWREMGAIHLQAGRIGQAGKCLAKFVERREYDPEGLYLLGETMVRLNRVAEAKELFGRTIEAVGTMPPYRRGLMRRWSGLAGSELKKLG
jgi:Flp pilus assembly protein TadD